MATEPAADGSSTGPSLNGPRFCLGNGQISAVVLAADNYLKVGRDDHGWPPELPWLGLPSLGPAWHAMAWAC